MPKIQVNGCQYHYEEHGQGAETLMLAHGLLWSSKMFHKQVEHFQDRFKIITYDHRGQGQSEVTKTGYDMDSLYEDAVALIEKLDLGPVHFGGLSMGGFIGMRLAARRPDLVKSLILMETSAEPEYHKLRYNLLKNIVRLFGVKSVTTPVMNIMFGQTFLNDHERIEEKQFWTGELQSNPKSIIKAVEGVINRKSIEDELENIQCPTLILVGTEDVATAPLRSEIIRGYISTSVLKYIKRGGHTGCIEEPGQYNLAIENFFKGELFKEPVL